MAKVHGAEKSQLPPAAKGDRRDPNTFTVKEPQGGAYPKTQITWECAGQAPLRVTLGPPGSKQVTIENGTLSVDAFRQKLVQAYLGAPKAYGTSDAADKYQDLLRRLAATLGSSEGELLRK
jgi:hypothetical protein